MKICFIVLKGMPFGGGIEKYTEELGSRLVQKGHEIVVYAMRHYGAKDGIYKGMKIKTVPTLRTKNLEKIVASLMSTIYQYSEKKVDIIHFHAFGPAIFNLIPRLAGIKVVVQGHGLEWRRSRWNPGIKLALKLTEFFSVKFPNRITVVSRVQQKYLRERYNADSIYIPTGVNFPQPEEPELIKQYGLKGNDYILFAARLVKEKGAHHLIEAYKRLNTDKKLVISGDIENEREYKKSLYKLSGKNKDIIFTGFITGKVLREVFSNCYMFVLPSEIEGLSTTLLEAMSYGNYCLASDIPENLEALGSLGHSFKCGDVDDLKNKMQHLIDDRSIIETEKKKSQSSVLENHSWDNIAEQFEKLYKELTAF
ncbi:MAG: glycosyltransferase family 4 protein [Candidatus Omnitrophica bacterium]|nr:glycosyltransferase family 4 protein [Candidatus Omnitrophota bacterium]MDD5430160.1 glycosyltransferase family 4 protein [Candidatus Omnitrophota bacterium]